MEYTVIIGLEVHVQLLTKTKVFCGCSNAFNPDNPNSQTCPVCLGLPGSLPVLNHRAFVLGVKAALALNCNIPPLTKWDRKHYYYPDLPKGYQVSQYDLPFSDDGMLEFIADSESGETVRVGIIRAHLEEDAGKNIHDESGRGQDSHVDLNRAGTPLLEIVSLPDLRSAQHARRFLEELRLLLTYLEVSDCNMQEGSLRCDANVNLHITQPDGRIARTPIVEIKNLNSFRAVELALTHEESRQLAEWKESGAELENSPKQTRGWDADRNVTFPQRGKEEASDYRYFPDPDLVPVTVSAEWLDEIRSDLCEFPADRRRRFEKAYEISNYDASVIIDQGRLFADYFEEATRICQSGKLAANWITQDVLRVLNERKQTIDDFPITPDVLGSLLKRVEGREISTGSARQIFTELLASAESGKRAGIHLIDELIDRDNLALVSDTGQLEQAIQAAIERNQKAAEDFRGGKDAALGRIIGEVMREVKGADPALVRQMLITRLRS